MTDQTDQTSIRTLTLAPFDVFLRTIAFKVRKAVGSFLSDEEVIANIDVMANFMKGVYAGGVSIDMRFRVAASVGILVERHDMFG